MNICLLNRFFDFRGSGVTRIAIEVSKELEKQGHSVTQYATGGDNLYGYAFQTGIAMPFRYPRKDIDVYHALATLEAMWLPKDKSIGMYLDLFTTTNPELAGAGLGYNKLKLLAGKLYFDIGSKIAAHCRYMTCISEKTKQDVLEHIKIDEKKLKVIRLGISESLKPLEAKSNHLTIGTLSQLDKRKRIDLLIEQFKDSKIDAKLLIAGQGLDRDKLIALADGDKRIQFLGLVADNKLNDFYNMIDIFAFPTAIEGYGLPIVEAMACNKPVIVLRDSIIPLEVKSKCVIVDDYRAMFNNYNNFVSILKGVNYKSNLAFAQSHSWANCVNEYIKLYKEVCNG